MAVNALAEMPSRRATPAMLSWSSSFSRRYSTTWISLADSHTSLVMRKGFL